MFEFDVLGREEEYKVWFENAAALALEKLSSPGVAIFYQAIFSKNRTYFKIRTNIFKISTDASFSAPSWRCFADRCQDMQRNQGQGAYGNGRGRAGV
jgi:hypothetical protein